MRDEPTPGGVDLRPYGYAPGGYLFTCVDCGPQDFIDKPSGAKRSWRCVHHAVLKMNEAIATSLDLRIIPPCEPPKQPSSGENGKTDQ